MPYQHGITVTEVNGTDTGELQSTAGIHVIVGKAPVNLAADPYAVTNVPTMVRSFDEAQNLFGYSEDFSNYNLCEAMYAYFKLVRVAPVVFINVLNPRTHKTEVTESVTITNSQGTASASGILIDTIQAVSGENELVRGTDYIANFNAEGKVVLSALTNKVGATISITAQKLNPEAVTDTDIVGGFNATTGAMTGIELVRSVYPKYGRYASVVIAPGVTSAVVAAALQAKTTDVNGTFSAETIIDISEATTVPANIKAAKDAAAIVSPHAIAVWPKAKVGQRVISLSAVLGALIAYYDAENDDVPCLTPSNKPIGISGICNANGAEIYIDQATANALNGFGIVTVININGWRTWGNNTAAYPETTEPKNRWIGSRRFFSWIENRFIIRYLSRVDSLANYRLVESIIEDENQFLSSLVASGKCAGARIEFINSENTIEQLEQGRIVFHQFMAPYPPAESIESIFEYDSTMLENALISIGGENA